MPGRMKGYFVLIAAIITAIATIIAALINRQQCIIVLGEAQATTAAFAERATQAIASLQNTIDASTVTALLLPTQTPNPTYTVQPTFTPYPTYTLLPSLTPPPLPSETPTPSIALPYEDTFDLRARAEWQPLKGIWRVVDGHLTADLNQGWAIIIVGDESWTDYVVETDVYIGTNFVPARIIVRATPEGYMAYQFTENVGGRWIVSKVDGTETTIADAGKSFFTGWAVNKLRIEVKGDIFTAFVNGTKVLQVQDGTFPYGAIGLGFDTNSYGRIVWFDNLRVTEHP